MIVKSLVENTSANKKILSEHGLSLYIEAENHKILFDMGQTDLFYKNSIQMNINLENVDIAIISHGHYDHGGGLKKFMEINKTAPIYITKQAFIPHYNGNEKYIGLDKDLLSSDRFIFVEKDLDLTQNIKILTCKGRTKDYSVPKNNLNMISGETMLPDDFMHEQYLLIHENGKDILFSGCSHNGILNIEKWFTPDILIGGFHFSKLDPETSDKRILDYSAKVLNEQKTIFYTCHCTGVKQYEYLKQIMKGKLRYLSAGETLTIN